MADNENPAQVRRPSVRGTFQETLLKLMVRGPVWTLSLLTRPQFIYMITSYAFKRGTPMVMPQPATAPGTAREPVLVGVFSTASPLCSHSIVGPAAFHGCVWLLVRQWRANGAARVAHVVGHARSRHRRATDAGAPWAQV